MTYDYNRDFNYPCGRPRDHYAALDAAQVPSTNMIEKDSGKEFMEG